METNLSVKGLYKNFGHKQVLNDISFSLEKGKITGLVGPNGAGKTTIMKAILGLIYYSKGTILIGPHVISPTSHQGLKKVGALIEYPGLYPYLTGYDHLKLFSEMKNDATIDVIVSKLNMENYILKKVKSYSLGMKQKLGIALALVNQPELVILDEPMNGLDPQATRDVRQMITELAQQGTAFLISSHILSELEKTADKLIIIDHGKIIAQHTMEEISTAANDYLIISTSDNHLATLLLRKSGYSVIEESPIKVLNESEEQLSDILQLFATNGIQVTDIRHLKNDLEASLLAILDAAKEDK